MAGWLENAWNYVINGESADAMQAKDDAADAWNLQRNQDLRNRGLISEQNADWAQEDILAHKSDVQDEIDAGFNEGLDEGINNWKDLGSSVGNVGNKVSTGLVIGFLKAIPWPVWLGLAAYGFFQFGGVQLVRSWMAKKR